MDVPGFSAVAIPTDARDINLLSTTAAWVLVVQIRPAFCDCAAHRADP